MKCILKRAVLGEKITHGEVACNVEISSYIIGKIHTSLIYQISFFLYNHDMRLQKPKQKMEELKS